MFVARNAKRTPQMPTRFEIRIAFRVSRKEYKQLGAHELWPQLKMLVTHRFSPEKKRYIPPPADLTPRLAHLTRR
jgi:hypothetical protein